jgi:hypothetical protein
MASVRGWCLVIGQVEHNGIASRPQGCLGLLATRWGLVRLLQPASVSLGAAMPGCTGRNAPRELSGVEVDGIGGWGGDKRYREETINYGCRSLMAKLPMHAVSSASSMP